VGHELQARAENIKLDKEMELLDLGAGTGLLSYFVAPFVKKIVAVDNSPSMMTAYFIMVLTGKP